MARGRAPAASFEPDEAARRFRGSVARKGARVVVSESRREHGDTGPERSRPAPWEPEQWVKDAEPVAEMAVVVPARRLRPPRSVPEHVRTELHDAVGATRVPNLERRLNEAVRAYERDRYQDALKYLKDLAQLAPMAPTVRELHGLTLYRLGRWRAAIKELEAFHALTASYDQHPVLMDSHRATGRRAEVERLWEELRQASPSQDVLAEGRIVLAETRAERGDVAGAIELLERARSRVRSPKLHHLRQWYALADLYEKVGEVPRARALFRTVLDHDPSLFDTAERLSGLG